MNVHVCSQQDDITRKFLDLRLDRNNLDNYFMRLSICKALQRARPYFAGCVLDVGCGRSPYRDLLMNAPSRATQYIGLDFANPKYTAEPDLVWDGKTIPLENAAVDSALATEVLEHNPEPEALIAEISRVLKPGGFFFATVPFLWPLHDIPYDEFRYTPFSLGRFFHSAGFVQVKIRALGGWDASLATMIGLWVRRRPLSGMWREVLGPLLLPVYRRLLSADRPPETFDRQVMITGLAVEAWKP
jgi:SAM-dependent methyltransferase